MRALLFLIVLAGCVQQQPLALEEKFAKSCADSGALDQQLCVKEETRIYWENVAQANLQNAISEEKKRVVIENADAAKCSKLGLKKGTGDYADCILKIEQSRAELAIQQQMLVNQQAAAPRTDHAISQQMQMPRREKLPIYPAQTSRRMKTGTSCSSTINGNQMDTFCY